MQQEVRHTPRYPLVTDNVRTKEKNAALHAEFESLNDLLGKAKEQYEALLKDIDAKILSKKAIEREVQDLRRQLSDIAELLEDRKTDASREMKNIELRAADVRHRLAELTFTESRLTRTVRVRQKKADDLEAAEKAHDAAVARTSAANKEAASLEKKNLKAKEQAEKILADAKKRSEALDKRKNSLDEREAALKKAQENLEFYRNRLSAYSVEHGGGPIDLN